MDLRYYLVFSIGLIMLSSSHTVFADNNIAWKVTIKADNSHVNGTGFWPPELQARQNDTIMWTNNDVIPHTITSGVTDHLNYSGKLFDSGILNPGQSFSFKIPPGPWSAYYYFCKIHPWMTGKIDVGVAYLGQSPTFNITTDKKSYYNGDTIRMSGVVNDTSQIMPLTLEIFDSQRNLIFSNNTSLLPDHSFVYALKATNVIFKDTGNYKIKALYGFPATVTDVNIFFNNENQNNVNISLDSFAIPYWVKNNAKWWSENQISDKDFVEGIQYLITSGDLKTGSSVDTIGKTDAIPSWIKNEAGWWAAGSISDGEFLSTVQYLIDHHIIST